MNNLSMKKHKNQFNAHNVRGRVMPLKLDH